MTAIFGDDTDEEDDDAQTESDAQSYSLTASFENHTGTLTREDGFWVSFDCEKDQIVFLDYDAFVRRNEGRLLIDVLSIDDPRSKDDVSLFKRSEGSYERYGDMLTLDLAAYGIDLVDDGKTCYVPVQTLSDFMLAVNYLNVYYNGEDFFLVPYQGLGNADDGYTPLGEKFYSVQPKQWSQAMADYNYAELCLAMDHLYGLKDIHHIESFDALLYQVGLRDAMKSTDPASQDEALYSLINLHLDHEFDEKDLGFTHLNLYCLTSPVSFSCGNLVPCVFKNPNEITLLGRTSGGGSCVVLPMSTACGTGFQMSGFTRLAFTKNGSFYDIDQGATPDFPMTKLASVYDRDALTDYINTLK